jgi:acyl transferase domain-containing protein
MALAGGVNIITSPPMFQNLADASFLSPTGASKAFDAAANGYCRGEGSGILVMKRMSTAISDGDLVLGVISGSAVNQGDNCKAIQVPPSGSQHRLYHQALSRGAVNPGEVTYV